MREILVWKYDNQKFRSFLFYYFLCSLCSLCLFLNPTRVSKTTFFFLNLSRAKHIKLVSCAHVCACVRAYCVASKESESCASQAKPKQRKQRDSNTAVTTTTTTAAQRNNKNSGHLPTTVKRVRSFLSVSAACSPPFSTYVQFSYSFFFFVFF